MTEQEINERALKEYPMKEKSVLLGYIDDAERLAYSKGLKEGYEMKEKENKWIPIGENSMPEIYQDVWTYRDLGDQVIIEHDVWQHEDSKYYRLNNITHWMPVIKPNPPQPETNK